jgi:hypothetical protein
MVSFVRRLSVTCACAALIVPALAMAQAPASSGASGPTPAGPPTPAPAETATAAPSSSAPASPATGYGWSATGATRASTPPPGTARRWRGPPKNAAPDATLPGFETLGDGSSRLFVELTKSVAVVEKKAPDARALTYVLKGARVHLHNNTNALVTVHFNTPVVRARLVPHGNDVLFVVELRANVSPTWKMTPAKDGTAILQVDFPRGDFLPGDGSPASTLTPSTPAPPATAPSSPKPR